MSKAENGTRLRAVVDLFVISLLSLYYELLVIRWLSSEIRIFAYFKNLPLMACVFGLGLGLALAGSPRNFRSWFPAALLSISLLISFAEPLGLIHIVFTDPVEHYLLGLHLLPDITRTAIQYVTGLVALAVIFYLIVFTFVCLGQKLGDLFSQFEPLKAYSINVGASIVGIALFSLISLLGWTPFGWLLLGALVAMWIYRSLPERALLLLAVAVAFFTASPHVLWSPYYRIYIDEWWIAADPPYPAFKYGTNAIVNHDFLEGAFDNRPESLAKLSPDQLTVIWEHYASLYRLIGEKPRSVLVLAAGMGNDVASHLRHGATDVDAVEIDPVIVTAGKAFHVERPYDSPRAHVYVDEARAFLRRGTKKYDLIDFAYLDSHAAFSSMSSVRLDDFIYTVESFRDALRRLKPDGILAVRYYGIKSWQTTRMIKTMTAALGYEPLGMFSDSGKNLILLAGPGLNRQAVLSSGLKKFNRKEQESLNLKENVPWDSIEPSTDDWPFLFLRNRGVTLTYAFGLLFTLAIGARLIKLCFGKFSTTSLGQCMFFLGAAFMLVEVKSVTQMGLLLGTTWFVNSAVIGSILIMILLANLLVLKFKPSKLLVFYVLLLASLLLNYFLPLSVFQSFSFLGRAMAGSLMLALPLMFAACIFAVSFSRTDKPHLALGMNLLGTLFGGVLEYVSMVLGINALNLLAIVLYLLAWHAWERETATVT